MRDINKIIALVEGDSDAIHPYDRIFSVSGAVLADNAYCGNLAAAFELHNKLMPPTNQYSIVSDPTCVQVVVIGWPKGLSNADTYIEGEGWGNPDNPARAWLLALLKANYERFFLEGKISL